MSDHLPVNDKSPRPQKVSAADYEKWAAEAVPVVSAYARQDGTWPARTDSTCPYKPSSVIGLWLLLVLVPFCFVYNTLVPVAMDKIQPGGRGLDEFIAFLLIMSLMAFTFAQITLAAIWAALSPQRITERIPIAVLLTILIWSSLVVGNYMANGGRTVDAEIIYTLGMSIGFGIFVIAVPLGIISFFQNWRFVRRDRLSARDDRFSIRNMLVATLLIAAALAVTRLFLPRDQPFQMNAPSQIFLMVGSIAFANIALIAPGVWIGFLPVSRLGKWMALWCLGIMIAGFAVGGIFTNIGAPGWIVIPMALMLFIEAGIVFAAMHLLRAAGYLLVRW